MKVTAMTESLVPSFKDYFKKYSFQQDESFPPGVDYKVRKDEPAYLLTDESGNLAGAAVLMMHREYKEAKTARFRMFHCKKNDYAHYSALLKAILKHTNGIDEVYCFADEKWKGIHDVWEKLGFTIKRYSWVLKRSTYSSIMPEFPEGYTLKTLAEGADEQTWCDIINESFANMMGHVPLYPSKINEWRKEPSYIEGGMKILWHNGKAIGTIALVREEENGKEIVFIEGVGLLNSYQGRGLGKNLLRAGVEFAKNFGVNDVMLSVNAENDKAAELYLKEGFEKEALIICYSLKVNSDK